MSELAQRRQEKAIGRRLAEVQKRARAIQDEVRQYMRAEATQTAKHAFDTYWLPAIERALKEGVVRVSSQHMYGVFFGRSIRPRVDPPYIDALKGLLGEPFTFTVKEHKQWLGLIRYQYLEISWDA